MEELTISGAQLIGFASLIGAIIVICNFFKAIMNEAKKPNEETEAKLKDHDEKLANDKKVIESLKKEQTILLQSQLVMIQHMIDGNGIDGLKEQRDKIQEYLIKR